MHVPLRALQKLLSMQPPMLLQQQPVAPQSLDFMHEPPPLDALDTPLDAADTVDWALVVEEAASVVAASVVADIIASVPELASEGVAPPAPVAPPCPTAVPFWGIGSNSVVPVAQLTTNANPTANAPIPCMRDQAIDCEDTFFSAAGEPPAQAFRMDFGQRGWILRAYVQQIGWLAGPSAA
jgi:hypothetical protein